MRKLVNLLLLSVATAVTPSRPTSTSTRPRAPSTYRPPRGGTFYKTQSYNNNNLTPLLLASLLLSTPSSRNRDFPSNCDNSTLTLTLANGTSYYNITEIIPVLELDPEGRNITANSVIALQCYRLKKNLASILALSICLGVPVVILLTCLLACCVCSIKDCIKDRREATEKEKERQKIEKQYLKEQQNWDAHTANKPVVIDIESDKAKLMKEVEEEYIYKVQFAPGISQIPRNWERFIDAGSYMRRVAQILDAKAIPYEVWHWIKFDDSEYYDYLCRQKDHITKALIYLLEREAKHTGEDINSVYANKYIPMMKALHRKYPLELKNMLKVNDESPAYL